jgi:hypothetical protein
MVRSPANEERSSVVLATAFDWPESLKRPFIETAVNLNPFYGVSVSDEDFVGFQVNLFVLIPNNCALLEDIGSLTKLDAAILERTASVKSSATLLSDWNGIARDVFTLIEDPGDAITTAIAVVLLGAALGFPDPVLKTPSEGFFLFFALFVMFPCHVTASKETSTSEQASTGNKLFLAVIIQVVPVLLLLLVRDVDLLVGVRSVASLVVLRNRGSLILLLLLLLLTVTTLLLAIAALLLAIAALLLTTIATLVITIVIRNTSPQSGGDRRAPIALRAMRLDDLVLVAFVLYDSTKVVLSSGFPAIDHFDFVKCWKE